MKYEEITKMEHELENKQVQFIKENIAAHNGLVELSYKKENEYDNKDMDDYYDQFPCKIEADGRHGSFTVNITSVYEKNGHLYCSGINTDDDSFEPMIPILPESFSTIAYFINHVLTDK